MIIVASNTVNHLIQVQAGLTHDLSSKGICDE
uniref:Uncharacterized protein n=1 Tax=viral metagenome TaxID=1070528 RepID=A0A6C0BMG5_9ZZZZ